MSFNFIPIRRLLLVLWSSFLASTHSEPDIIPKNAKIVEGTDRVSGSGLDQSLAYVPPSGFYGPEALFLLHGTCITDTIDRYEYTICPFENVTQKRILGGKPTLLGVWGSWREPETHTDGTPPTLPYHVMDYGRGQSCGHSTRKVSVEIVEAADFGILADSVVEKPTCTFFFKFGIPYSMDILGMDIIAKPLDAGDEAVIDHPQAEIAMTPKDSAPHVHPQVSATAAGGQSIACPAQPAAEAVASVADRLSAKLAAAQEQIAELQSIVTQLKIEAISAGSSK